MNLSYKRLDKMFMHQSKRERQSLMLMAVVVVVGLFELFVFSGFRQQIKMTNMSLMEMQSSNMALQQEYDHLLVLTKNSSDSSGPSELETSLEEIDGRIDSLSSQLIRPQYIAGLLHEFIDANANLQLVSYSESPYKDTEEQSVSLKRHKVNLVLIGGYFDTLDYLRSVENLSWRVAMEEVDYRVEVYPKAIIRVDLSTVESIQEWIGAY